MMSSNPKLMELNESLELTNQLLREHSYHLSRIAAALERVAEGLDLLSTNKIVYARGQSPCDGGNPHFD